MRSQGDWAMLWELTANLVKYITMAEEFWLPVHDHMQPHTGRGAPHVEITNNQRCGRITIVKNLGMFHLDQTAELGAPKS